MKIFLISALLISFVSCSNVNNDDNKLRVELMPLLRELAKLPVDHMLPVIFSAVKASATSTSDSIKSDIADVITVFVHSQRYKFKHPMPELDLPCLDPFKVKLYDLGIDTNTSRASLVVEDTIVHGVSNFEIKKLDIGAFNFTIHVPVLKATGKYYLNGHIENVVNLNGDGPFRVDVYDPVVYGSADLKFKGSYIHMETLNLDVKFDTLQANLSNFMGGNRTGELMNELVNGIAHEVVEEYKGFLLPFVEERVKKIVNKSLGRKTVADIWEWISSHLVGKVSNTTLSVIKALLTAGGVIKIP